MRFNVINIALYINLKNESLCMNKDIESAIVLKPLYGLSNFYIIN